KQKKYNAHALRPIANSYSEMIYDFQNRNRIKEQIKNIVEIESPISKNQLYKKVLQAWDTSRAGAKLDKHLEEIISEINLIQTLHHQPFYWSENKQIDFYRSNEIEKRNIEDIAPEEI